MLWALWQIDILNSLSLTHSLTLANTYLSRCYTFQVEFDRVVYNMQIAIKLVTLIYSTLNSKLSRSASSRDAQQQFKASALSYPNALLPISIAANYKSERV